MDQRRSPAFVENPAILSTTTHIGYFCQGNPECQSIYLVSVPKTFKNKQKKKIHHFILNKRWSYRILFSGRSMETWVSFAKVTRYEIFPHKLESFQRSWSDASSGAVCQHVGRDALLVISLFAWLSFLWANWSLPMCHSWKKNKPQSLRLKIGAAFPAGTSVGSNQTQCRFYVVTSVLETSTNAIRQTPIKDVWHTN